MRFARREDRTFAPGKLRLPLVAMVDVVLFLLLYFLVVGTLAGEEGLLPSAVTAERQGTRASDLQPQIVFVESRDGRARFRVGEHISQNKESLTEILRQLPLEGGVVVRVTPDVQVDHAAAALQACNDAGFRKISYVPGS